MTPSEGVLTQPAVNQTFESPEDKKNEPQYMAADAYYEFQITLSQDVIYEEATDEEFLLAALNSSAFDFWRTDDDDDLFDPNDVEPI